MNKYLLVASSLFLAINFSSSAQAMSVQQVKSAYESALNSIFSNPNAIGPNKKLNQTAVNACYKAALDIKSFVDSHSKNLVGVKDSLLNKAAATLERITTDAINNMKIIRNMPLASIEKQLNIFKQLKSECINTRALVEKESFNIAAKKEAKDVLLAALYALNNFINGDLVAMELAFELA